MITRLRAKVPLELLLFLVILVVIALLSQAINSSGYQEPTPNLMSDSATATGSKALYLWLDELGYDVQRLQYQHFEPDRSMKVMFILAPTIKPSVEELNALQTWVERGGTLIVAGGSARPLPDMPIFNMGPTDSGFSTVIGKFGLKTKQFDTPLKEAIPSQPLLMTPSVSKTAVNAGSYFTGDATIVPYLGDYERPIAVGITVGKGHVYALADIYAFSNEGINRADNAALLLNWLPAPSKSGVVTIDEIHHGRIIERSVTSDAVRKPWGWALIYGLGILFIYLLIGGRRFGRAIPAIPDNRRLAAEYVTSVAGLLRRGGKSAWVVQHYERTLRRQLVALCGLNADDDTSILNERLERIGTLPGGVDGRDARRVLASLRLAAEKGLSEAALVRLVAETDRISKALGGRR
jgi:hypothetical protein